MTDTTPPRRSRRRIALAAGFGAAALTLTGVGVYAGLNATATGTQSVTSGTLLLSMTNNGVGFSAGVSNMAPGDVVNRYVDLTNGSMDGKTLTLGVTDSTPTKLSTDGGLGLQVTVNGCAVAWVVTSTAGTCAAPTTVMGPTSVHTLSTTPGSVATTFAAGGMLHLQIVLTLPDQSETSTNGALPGSTIQGLSSNLTYTFTEQQRTATTTNS